MGDFHRGFTGRESWNHGGPNPFYPKRVPFHAPTSQWTVDNWAIYYMAFGPLIVMGMVVLIFWNAAFPWKKPVPINSRTGFGGFFLLFLLPVLPLYWWLSKRHHGIR
ncbi:MAG: hypothetical protein EA402_14290 [Planctomycetota bacterium]|nr:MAG: hypothetical protein EA402_14290 [Planctomycetota bacterium]